MAVETNTYGTVERVEALIPDIPESGTFETTTNPTEATVEQHLNDVADEIHVHLIAAGYTVPVDSSAYSQAHGYLINANVAGAIVAILSTFGFEPDTDDDQVTDRIAFYQKRFKNALKMIDDKKLVAGMDEGVVDDFYAGGQEDKDGNTRKPVFTLDGFDKPGGFTRTESDA